ncbi:hypothetical protein OZL92_17775 [Bacillus sonorensis]|uniref:Uncharacterized protein n=2 Tax=Bacillus sonorensis TaxID=119858 RepID=M5P6G0_9BACI|nr:MULTISPECIES: hypothetical protein [Bacillus]TWK84198.1 hypothetical protein CHCC20335_4266 [Bacillus paralicheniformis]ASB89175.1 hypothetical protein S101395_02668 [Bacillus sonorensis]EME75601.1 hypothetical protein BSONL12_04783 [Bacillus sonorensis L12]MCF7618513.1 hypothetical protein [Bacillus sonorensis]MCY7858706.1 hypothetical protein [Bacillus sonorensis]
MDNQVLQAIYEMQKEMKEGFKSVNERLDTIDKTLTRIEENEPEEVISMLKLINKNIERDHRYNDKKFSELNEGFMI